MMQSPSFLPDVDFGMLDTMAQIPMQVSQNQPASYGDTPGAPIAGQGVAKVLFHMMDRTGAGVVSEDDFLRAVKVKTTVTVAALFHILFSLLFWHRGIAIECKRLPPPMAFPDTHHAHLVATLPL